MHILSDHDRWLCRKPWTEDTKTGVTVATTNILRDSTPIEISKFRHQIVKMVMIIILSKFLWIQYMQQNKQTRNRLDVYVSLWQTQLCFSLMAISGWNHYTRINWSTLMPRCTRSYLVKWPYERFKFLNAEETQSLETALCLLRVLG